MRVEEMDTSLQTSFAECIIDGYKQTADGVDNRFAYMDIEYSLEERPPAWLAEGMNWLPSVYILARGQISPVSQKS